MFVFLGFCNKSGEMLKAGQVRYCKIVDTKDGAVELFKFTDVKKICSMGIHILFLNTKPSKYSCDESGYNSFINCCNTDYNYKHPFKFCCLVYRYNENGYYCFSYDTHYTQVEENYDYNFIFTLRDIQILSCCLNLKFTYINSNIIKSITNRIDKFLIKVKLSNTFKYQVYLEEKDCFDIDYDYPFTSLCLYVCESKDDLERIYDLFNSNIVETFNLKIKKWYRVYSDVFLHKVGYNVKDDTIPISFESAELSNYRYGLKIGRLKKFKDSAKYSRGNDFYALELWYSTKMIYKKKFPEYTLSDLINKKIK